MTVLNGLLWSSSMCGIDDGNIKKELEKQYAQEIKSLNFNFEEGYRHLDATCEKIPKTDKVVFAFPYAVGEDGLYTLSLILAIVEQKTQIIEQSYFHKNIAQSDAVYISGLELDTSLYEKNILKLALSFSGASHVNPYTSTSMFLYAIKNNKIKVVLDGFNFSETNGENNMCYYHDTSHYYSWKNKKSFTLPNTLVFKHDYKYEESDCEDASNEKYWHVKLEPLKFVYKNGKYRMVSKIKPIFNLKEVEANAKKGLRYKEMVLKAMLFEEYLFKKNVNRYNNIAYYLQKAGHNKEAMILLKEIVNRFPNRMVAHYNLADVYWALGQKDKAHKHYGVYIEQMKKARKEKRIPSIVKEHYKASQNSFEKGFVAMHKKVQSISPLLLENRGAEAIAVVPWLQKKLFYVDDANDGKLVRVIAYKKNGKMEFVYFLMSTVKNEVGLLKLFRIDQEKNKSFLIGEVPSNFIEEDINSKYFPSMTQDEFLIKGQTVYFFRFNNDKGDDYYRYRYDFGDKKIKPFRFTIDKNRESYLQRVYAHNEEMFAESSNGELLIGVDGETHVEFVTQEMDGEFVIGSETWSEDDKILYFDNYGELLACIWRYDLETKELSKIVPEHEAEHPFAFTYKGKEYVVYIENQDIKVAMEGE